MLLSTSKHQPELLPAYMKHSTSCVEASSHNDMPFILYLQYILHSGVAGDVMQLCRCEGRKIT